MRCPNCQNDNPPNLTTCDWCGAPLPRTQKIGTMIDPQGAPPPSAPAVSGPSEKRKTMYEAASLPWLWSGHGHRHDHGMSTAMTLAMALARPWL